MFGLNKHEILASVLWASAIVVLYKYGVQEPWVMAMAGFNSAYGYCHKTAKGFKIRSFFSGIFGALAGIGIMGLIWSINQGSGVIIFVLASWVFIGISYHIGRKVSA